MTEEDAKSELRGWILERAQAGPDTKLENDTPVLEEGLLSSLDVVELILFIESLKGDEVDVDDIEPESFRDVDTIYASFLS